MTSVFDPPSLSELMDLHFDPEWGTPYWLERLPLLGFDPRTDIRSTQDLARFGPFPEEELRKGPSIRFVPRRFHAIRGDLVSSETGGTTGAAKRVYFSEKEFRAGFVDPFVRLCRSLGWPLGGQWLYLGPSGPHVIGKVVDPICAALESPPAFRIDFDPRWSLQLAKGSVARARYLEHLVDQALAVLEQENVEILFGTPAILERLAERTSEDRRASIAGVHYGGTALTLESYRRFRTELYPNAVHLSGYGNSLVGVAFEAGTAKEDTLLYYPTSPRHLVRPIPIPDNGASPRLDLEVPLGEVGQVVVSRLDCVCFIPNLVERDIAVAVAPTSAARALGWNAPGIGNPQPLADETKAKGGFY